MAVKNRGKQKEIIDDRGKGGCEMCGSQKPNLPNKGLEVAHIVSKNDGGDDSDENLIALCPNCAGAFDLVLKSKIWKALQKHKGKVPEGWKNAEGRGSKEV